MNAKIDLKDMTLAEIEQFIQQHGQQKFRARQVAEWIFKRGVNSFAEMSNLSTELRDRLEQIATIGNLEVAAKQVSEIDNTTKYLFSMPDGQAIETVFMVYSYGNSVCVSSQVGCNMGCGFCASTIGGKVRNLTAGEIYNQVLTVEKDQGKRVSNVVIMGSGEPLDNYYNVVKFMALLNAEYALNIGYRHITLSTCGVVPGIKKLAAEDLPITLSISLHAPNDELRDQIMPVNKKYPLPILIEACKEYILKTNRRLTFEYSLIAGFNDSMENARELAHLLRGLLCHVNLIPVNQVKEKSYQRPDKAKIQSFAKTLSGLGIETTIRRELGTDIDAACGQLRRKYLVLETKEV